MEIANERRTGPKRIGELLVSANIVRPEALLHALKEAKSSSRPIGRVLMTMGVLKERDLEAALELQSMLREGLVTNQFGIRALNLAIKSDISLTDSFLKLGWQPPERPAATANELAQLFLDAQIVPRKQMDEAVARSTTAKMPLGRCLVLSRAVSTSLLSSALTAQVMLRDGKISREQAIAGLKAAFRKQQPIEQSLSESGAIEANRQSLRIGDLLTSAGLVTEGDKMSAVEQGLLSQQPIGQVLLRQGLLSQALLNDTLKVQELVNSNQISPQQGTDLLRDSHARGMAVEAILAEWQNKERDVERSFKGIAILEKAGILSEAEVGRMQATTVHHKTVVLELLKKSGRLTQLLLEASMQADSLVEDQIIGIDQAIAVLLHCQKFNVDFHAALQNTPWEDRSQPSPQAANPASEPQRPQVAEEEQSWLNNLWSKVKRKE
jgi:hypothetical protein